MVFGRTKFYRVDTGGAGDRTSCDGNRRVIVKDGAGEPCGNGRRAIPVIFSISRSGMRREILPDRVSRIEPQILKAEQIPEKIPMSLSNLSVNEEDERFQVKLEDCDLSDETSESFLFLKAQTEEILGRNGYEVPVTAGGIRSLEDVPVYSRGVKKGQKDLWGMTTDPGESAKKTVYGAAVQEITVPVEKNSCVLDLTRSIFTWYQEHPQ
ncbi:MAG: hypothetical protein ACLTFJ_11530 [Clostridium sp.]